ncbi:TetR/AcrR family transcriptional regulator [Aeromicrobium endophyticum]|uniref:TetR/AcrR family transcriptional regulator n=1 Tax=Aeromicrobium endophyticum TaxID=2292704 RepID=A0A371NYV6_9ACTN|nr:TetR/AcrR family transcriptional regulator [Aeromicrobium endophyticum]REK68872.1 TetR/AcrR family transcriptional regulator [Aeromicrobium endophyticum]
MAHSPTEIRAALLQAAEQLLVASEDSDVSTRAVCDRVGVGQPVLYRVFGDKQGLLDALAEVGLERYAARKVELEVTADPVADLRKGWTDHLVFASENPAIYRLMFSPRPGVALRARDGILELLKAALRRVAAAGALQHDLDESAAMILSANVGLAMNRLTQPAVYDSPRVSDALRDALFDRILIESPRGPGDVSTGVVARQLAARIETSSPPGLAAEESALLRLWLKRLSRSS